MIDTIDICPEAELPPGAMRVVEHEDLEIAVINCNGVLFAVEDRCSHDDGPLVEGLLDEERCTIECPRHGSLFDLKTGKPMTLPAYEPIETFPIRVEGVGCASARGNVLRVNDGAGLVLHDQIATSARDQLGLCSVDGLAFSLIRSHGLPRIRSYRPQRTQRQDDRPLLRCHAGPLSSLSLRSE